ncbi:MAG: hypothetical protein AAF570_01140 [Bacteroidota bacterium]
MKKLLSFSLLTLLCLQLVAAGGGDKYIKAMKSALTLMDSVKSMDDMQNVANRFERIGNAEKKEWLPYYYTALCYTNMSYMQQDVEQKDPLLDKAQAFIDKAAEHKMKDRDKSEVVCVKGMIASARIQVDPQKRSMQYGPQSGMLYQKARTLNPDNPRPTYNSGVSLFFTPEQFGGGKEKGAAMLEKAIELYDKWEAPSEIYPAWGREFAESMLKMAKGGGPMPWEQEGGQEGGEKAAPDQPEQPAGTDQGSTEGAGNGDQK